MRVLVIEDSSRLRTHLGRGLKLSGFAVDLAADGEEGLWMAESNDYDVIVLDLMLPKMDGLSVLERLREQGCSTRVLILSARDTVEDRVNGLDHGADDYLIKPFALEELVARIQTLVRRRYERPAPHISIGELTIDTAAREVHRGQEMLDLSPRLYRLLHFLASRQGEVISRTEIEEHIYDDQVEPLSNVVDSAICQLRRKIDAPGNDSMIVTRRGMGYMLRSDAP